MGVVAVKTVLLALFAPACGQGDKESGSRLPTSATGEEDVEGAGDYGGTRGDDPDVLGDGTHEVQVVSVDPRSDTVTLDGVQVLEGTEAVLAYLADTDGQQLEGAQVYLRNRVEAPRELPVDPGGEFAVVFGASCCDPEDLGWHGFSELAGDGFPGLRSANPPFEATIDGGVVTSLVQLHLPQGG